MCADRPGCPPVVRDATLADVAAMESCYNRADHRSRIRGADGQTSRYLVVEFAGQVAGFARLWFAQPANRPIMGGFPRIANLNVRADMRGRGLASLLIATMERLAWAGGHRILYIGVHPDNATARSLYGRLGYQPMVDPAGPVAVERVGSAVVLELMKDLSCPES